MRRIKAINYAKVPIRAKQPIIRWPKEGDLVSLRGVEGVFEFRRRNACATYLRRRTNKQVILPDGTSFIKTWGPTLPYSAGVVMIRVEDP